MEEITNGMQTHLNVVLVRLDVQRTCKKISGFPLSGLERIQLYICSEKFVGCGDVLLLAMGYVILLEIFIRLGECC